MTLKPPYIDCEKCGKSHHIDHTIGEFQGRCVECSGFLRRPTEAECHRFADFMSQEVKQFEDSDDGIIRDIMEGN